MKDAFGGILNLAFLAVFLLLVMGILGLIVNYTKAFRMKNFTIDYIERYEGSCRKGTDACIRAIKEKAQSISYSPTIKNCPSGFTNMDGYFCMKIIETVLSFRIFQVTGNTEVIEIPNGKCG